MKRALTLTIGVISLALSAASARVTHAATSASTVPGDAELAAFAREVLNDAYPADGPGAAVLVRRDGRTVLREGFGLANLDLRVPIDPSHVFEIGSVTKQFTGAALLRLAEQGKLALEDPITKFVPGLPAAYQAITLTHLLTHTAGVPSYTGLPEWRPRWREDMTVDTLIGLFRDRPLEFVPGQSWSYSNSGYILLGAAIEKVSGKSYEDYVEQELFAPLGMTSSRYGHQEEVVPGKANGYVKGPDGWANAPYLSLTQPYAAGSLMSTVDDLGRWSDALESGKAIAPASRDRMFTPAVLRGGEHDGVSTRYGLGNGVPSIAGHAAHEHGGGIPGYVCDLLRVPDADLLVVVLSNNMAVSPDRLVRKIAEKALGGRPPAAPAVALSAAALDDYVGVYRMPEIATGRRIVTRDGDALRLRSTGGEADGLRALGDDRFETVENRSAVRFLRDAGGNIVAVEVDDGSGPMFKSPRTDEPIPPERKVAALPTTSYGDYVGHYQLMPGMLLAVSREGDRLFAEIPGQPRFEIFPESPDHFFVKVVDAQLVFVRDGGGAVASVILHQGGRQLPGPRVR
jgi:CubicO group peptidase (beta-lactamase class C family)